MLYLGNQTYSGRVFYCANFSKKPSNQQLILKFYCTYVHNFVSYFKINFYKPFKHNLTNNFGFLLKVNSLKSFFFNKNSSWIMKTLCIERT